MWNILLVLATCLTQTFARGGRGDKGGEIKIKLDLSSVPAALFSISLIFAVILLLQTVGLFSNLQRLNSTHPRSAFSAFTLSSLLTTTAYAMYTANIGIDYNQDNPNGAFFPWEATVASFFFENVRDILIIIAFLALLAYSERTRSKQGRNRPSHKTAKTIFDIILVSIFLATLIATTAIYGVLPSMANPESGLKVVNALYHFFAALDVVLAINIVASAIALRRRIAKMEPLPDKIVNVVANPLAPLFLVLTVHKLIVDIILTVNQALLDSVPLTFTSLIIPASIYVAMFNAAIKICNDILLPSNELDDIDR